MTDVQKRPRGRPRVLTDEQKKELVKIRNANRGPQRIIYRMCQICEYDVMSQNYNKHLLSRRHNDNKTIKDLTNQLENQKNINIPNSNISEII